jgi:large subunit ribosomal protein L9
LLTFPARASETGKLYGSVTTQMIADALSDKAGVEIGRRQIDSQPLRNLGEHTVQVRLTVDLIPEVKVIVHREGESPDLAVEKVESGEEAVDVQSEGEDLEEVVETQVEEEPSSEENEVEDFESKPTEEAEN